MASLEGWLKKREQKQMMTLEKRLEALASKLFDQEVLVIYIPKKEGKNIKTAINSVYGLTSAKKVR